MLDWLLMLQVKLPIVDTLHPQNNKFVMGVENAATGDSRLNADLLVNDWKNISIGQWVLDVWFIKIAWNLS